MILENASIRSNDFFVNGGETGELLRTIDWSSTPLGNIEEWPQSLLTSLSICLNSKFPMLILWGKEMYEIYNDAYSKVIGDKHPAALGRKSKEVWPELKPWVWQMIEGVFETGEATWSENELILLSRDGYTEENYFTFSYSPIYDENGGVGGVFTAVIETTDAVVHGRHLNTLGDISKSIARNSTTDEVYRNTLKVLDKNKFDFPYTILFKVAPDGKTADLVGATGIKLPHSSAPEKIDFSLAMIGSRNVYKSVLTSQVVSVQDIRQRLGDMPSGPWNVPPEEALILPITDADQQYPFAILVIGVNPHHRLNDKYRSFFEMITEQVSIEVSNITRHDNQMSALVEVDRNRREIHERGEQMKMAVEATGLGTWDYHPLTGVLNWSEECKKIYAIPGGVNIDFEMFSEHIYPDDREYMLQAIAEAVKPGSGGKYDVTVRIIRFGDNGIRWIRSQGHVYFNQDGTAERFIGTVIDITDRRGYETTLRESEQRLRLAIASADQGTFDWDLQNQSFFSLERLIEIFGYAGEENITHQHLLKVFHPEDKPHRDLAVEEAKTSGNMVYDARIIWKDGAIHWIRVHGKVVFGANGEPLRMYGIVVDITSQKNLADLLEKKIEERTASLNAKNAELKRSEERYHRMTEEVQDYAIIMLDRDGTIINWNKGAEKIKGYTEEEIIGRSFKIFYLPEDKKNKLPEKLLSIATETGRATHEGLRVRKDGSTFWGSITITALHDSNGEIIGFSKVTRDLTERKLAEDKLKEYTINLEYQNKELQQFAYVASHDLQEPLRKIQTFSEILERNMSDAGKVTEYLGKIKASAFKMSALIKSVLNYSRLSVSEVQFESVDLNAILENVKTDLELLIQEKNVVIRYERLPVIAGIPSQMGQLFFNLISNSIKFSERRPEITISCKTVIGEKKKGSPHLQPNKTYAEIIFKDNGIGFEQKYEVQMFTIFQRLHGYNSYPGTGIGLALCKKIIDNHHGFITAKGELNKGATFCIYLPIQQ